ncbi:MAG: hypothetical protein M1834_003606 [Cirrosporium novae-zelandiae]|nr:MAG: hypothetical protein M1834_003606 [Cirrosporium novae-zelandiae]
MKKPKTFSQKFKQGLTKLLKRPTTTLQKPTFESPKPETPKQSKQSTLQSFPPPELSRQSTRIQTLKRPQTLLYLSSQYSKVLEKEVGNRPRDSRDLAKPTWRWPTGLDQEIANYTAAEEETREIRRGETQLLAFTIKERRVPIPNTAASSTSPCIVEVTNRKSIKRRKSVTQPLESEKSVIVTELAPLQRNKTVQDESKSKGGGRRGSVAVGLTRNIRRRLRDLSSSIRWHVSNVQVSRG